MTILITATSGHLGRLVVESLLERGAEPGDILATARDTDRIADLAARGVRTAELDYDRPDTIAAALEGVERLLLISGSVPGARVDGHRNVIEAAARAGVAQLVYTSAPQATTTDFLIAADHKATEEIIDASGIPAVVLRNNWYLENYADDIRQAADSGVIAHSAGDGRIAMAARRDYADAAAAVLRAPIEEYTGQVLELAGDEPWTFDDLAAAVAEVTGREVRYQRLSTDEHVALLRSFGLDEGTAGFVVAMDAGIASGGLAESDDTLARVLGRPLTPRTDTIRSILAS